jgi:hypothetical protein
MTTNSNADRYYRAKKKVEEIRGFYIHLMVYLIFVPFFIWLNFRTTSFPWALFPIVGWGVGLLFHGFEAFGYSPFFGKNWEQRKIRELMEKEDKFKID